MDFPAPGELTVICSQCNTKHCPQGLRGSGGDCSANTSSLKSSWVMCGSGLLASLHPEGCSVKLLVLIQKAEERAALPEKSTLQQRVRKRNQGSGFALQHSPHCCAYFIPLLQLHHADDGFLVLTTDGINFMVNSQEICDFINQCHDPAEAAHVVTEQVMLGFLEASKCQILARTQGRHFN